MTLKAQANEGVAAARAYVEAALGLQVCSHRVYQRVMSDPHSHAAVKK